MLATKYPCLDNDVCYSQLQAIFSPLKVNMYVRYKVRIQTIIGLCNKSEDCISAMLCDWAIAGQHVLGMEDVVTGVSQAQSYGRATDVHSCADGVLTLSLWETVARHIFQLPAFCSLLHQM